MVKMVNFNQIDLILKKKHKLFHQEFDIYAFLANFSTLSNVFLGLFVSISIFLGYPMRDSPYLAIRAIVLAASFDAVDGKLARRSTTKPRFGAQFDTFADLVSFGFAPATMLLDVIFFENQSYNTLILGFLVSGIYLFSASFRLSRFIVESNTTKSGYFQGMPSPPAAIFICGWFIQPTPNLILLVPSVVFISSLMITSLPYTAMRSIKTIPQKIYTVFTISIMLLFTYSPNSWMIFLGKIWIIYIVYFGLLGPIHANRTIPKLVSKSSN